MEHAFGGAIALAFCPEQLHAAVTEMVGRDDERHARIDEAVRRASAD